jgi:hypothetical protein
MNYDIKKIIGGVCLVAITLNLGFANQTNDSLKDNDNNIWDVAFVYVYQDRPATLHSKYIEVGNLAKVVPSWNNKDGTRYADGLEGTSARTDFSFDGIFEMFYGEMKSNMSSVADGFNTYRLKDSSAIGVGSNASEPGSLYIAQEFKLIIQDFDDDGYIFITGRVDDIINVAGHRLSTAEMEEIVASHKDVAECAVFGVHCDLKGQQPLGLIVLKNNEASNHRDIQKQIVSNVRREIGAVAAFKNVLVVQRLPKTRSGKILRKLLRNIADEQEYKIPSTIDDLQIIPEIKTIYKKHLIGIHK